MMKTPLFLLFFIFSHLSLSTIESYTKSPDMEQSRWDMLAPYFLPENHPIKSALDKMFNGRERICTSRETLEYAGFALTRSDYPNRIIVGKHPYLKGYLIKFHTDDQLDVDESYEWLWRIQGALVINEGIKKNGFQHLFKVPKKWIYPLTKLPMQEAGLRKTNYLLVVEDMKAFSTRKNLDAWYDPKMMTREKMDAFYTMLQGEGLLDSIHPDNTPFTKDGRMAFLDTQHCQKWPIRFEVVNRFLCPENQAYWNQLIQNGGPKH